MFKRRCWTSSSKQKQTDASRLKTQLETLYRRCSRPLRKQATYESTAIVKEACRVIGMHGLAINRESSSTEHRRLLYHSVWRAPVPRFLQGACRVWISDAKRILPNHENTPKIPLNCLVSAPFYKYWLVGFALGLSVIEQTLSDRSELQ